MRIARLPTLAFGASVLLLAAPPREARANGRLPTASQLLFSPSDPSLILLRTTFGILVSHDGGATWDWLCEAALGIASSQIIDPNVGITANGTVVAGFLDTLLISPNTGCDWAPRGARSVIAT